MAVETDSPFGARLRALRLAAGLSQDELAHRVGLDIDAIASLEHGRQPPPPDTLSALSGVLGIDIGQLRPAGVPDADLAGSLPEPKSPMIGRDFEQAELIDLLTGPVGTVTLSGPAGVGKTRLAISVAHQLARSGVWAVHWVRLDEVAEPSLVPAAVATSIGARDGPDPDPTAAVLDRFGGAPTVLVLDSCDHVLGSTTRWCSELVASSDRLRVLATSREAMGADGEIVVPVAPLPVPAVGDRPSVANLRNWPATRLFLDRAQDVATELTLDEATADAVARVCRALDGLPLAIELAAAGMGTMSVGQLAADLDSSVKLPSTAKGSIDRHRTLDAAIGWSYELLAPAERVLFGRLSVAAGGWTLDAARHFAVGGIVGPGDVLALSARLADKSLIALDTRSGIGRYTMLGVIRQHARGRLAAAGEVAAVSDQHARFYTDLAERAAAGVRGPSEQRWLEWLDPEVDNLRAAQRHWLEGGDVNQGLRAGIAMWRFAYLRGRYGEGRDLLDAALQAAATAPDADPLLWAGALVAAGTLAYLQCEYDTGAGRIQDGLTLYRGAGQVTGTADALQRLGSIARERGSYTEAIALHEEALQLWQTTDDRVGAGDALNFLAFVHWLTGDWQRCDAMAHQALDRFGGRTENEGVAWALLNLGISARYRGELTRAAALLQESRQLSARLGFAEGTAWCLDQLGALDRTAGRLDTAWSLQQQGLTMHARMGDRWRASGVLDGLAATAVRRRRYQTAARLLGTADALRESIGTPIPPCERAEREATVATTAEGLGPQRYAELTGLIRPERMLARLVSGIEPAL